MKLLIPILVLLICSFACDKQDESPDFRKDYCGSYMGLYTYYHISGSTDDGWILSQVDTLSHNQKFSFEMIGDSSILVSCGDDPVFTGKHVGGEKFVCMECSGPPDYAYFTGEDSVVVYMKLGVTNSLHFYGKKQ